MPKADQTVIVSALGDTLLKAAEQAGLSTTDLIELLKTGLTAKEILLYAQTGISNKLN
jgi:hypothetical protein